MNSDTSDLNGTGSGKWRIWIDRGGTFTDLVAMSPSGETFLHKILSTRPGCRHDAAVQGIREVMGIPDGEDIPSERIAHVKMGTTVATNALLERKGERTLLVITKGFGDMLQIGYQNRPRIFDLHIVLPEPLYGQVVEADERLDAEGETVRKLDEAKLGEDLEKARESGIDCVAIVLMHGYRHPRHEKAAAGIARRLGFSHVSVSHEVSPLARLVARGDTTVADAYLSPILRRHVSHVAADLAEHEGNAPKMMFMRSDGGLTWGELFRGKDAVLSGPAGGVVGMVGTGLEAGHERLIGFDMGGTSTDVSHYDGSYERTYEKTVAGVRIKAPMMDIHTVAAGGGSILKFDGLRYRVGPESAGAVPGPACYRLGGPLTVTDCNVMTGKIIPEFFPSLFGSSGNEPIDKEIVRKRFGELAAEISIETGEPVMPEEVAEGFVRIACENMANAIKKISVERGHDIASHTLNCFGGAGGQHACLVADLLGIRTVLIHPHAGMLSAYGMGLAEIRAVRQAPSGNVMSAQTVAELAAVLDTLGREALTEVNRQVAAGDEIRQARLAHVRYAGTDATLEIPFGNWEEMANSFQATHRRRFGFADHKRDLVVDSVSVEAIGNIQHRAQKARNVVRHVSRDGCIPDQVGATSLFSSGAWHSASVFSRDTLPAGWFADGPVVVIDKGGTNIVEKGWRCRIMECGEIEMARTGDSPVRISVGTEADPVMLEVFSNLFMSIAEQMGVTLKNTSSSVNIKERLDFSCAIFSPDGSLVANAPHVPVHLGSMGESVRAVIAQHGETMRPGDSYALNAPYNGGSHLPDLTLVTPVFDDEAEKMLFFVGSRAHHSDMGGKTPGSSPPDSTHIEEEGVLIDNFLMVRDGRFLEKETRALLGSGRYPCRNPDQNVVDIIAQIAANETGVREVRKMISRFEIDVVQAYMRHVQDNAEEAIRRVISRLRDGSFTYHLDNGLTIKVRIGIERGMREALIDFAGTSPQDSGNFNAPLAVSKAAVLYVFRTLAGDDIPLNEGCMRPIRISVPDGSMLSPRPPAAVIAGNTEVSQCVADALYGALGVLASSQGTMNNFVYGNDRYQNYETICGGSGAGPDHDGTDAVHTHMTNTRLTDPEVLESRYPVHVEEFSIRSGSGGSGRHCGGNGVLRKIRFLEKAKVTTLTLHRTTEPYGLEGGLPGKRGRNHVIRANGQIEERAGIDAVDLDAGDMFVMETPGGGGFGG